MRGLLLEPTSLPRRFDASPPRCHRPVPCPTRGRSWSLHELQSMRRTRHQALSLRRQRGLRHTSIHAFCSRARPFTFTRAADGRAHPSQRRHNKQRRAALRVVASSAGLQAAPAATDDVGWTYTPPNAQQDPAYAATLRHGSVSHPRSAHSWSQSPSPTRTSVRITTLRCCAAENSHQSSFANAARCKVGT
jgi:hypothetical protein